MFRHCLRIAALLCLPAAAHADQAALAADLASRIAAADLTKDIYTRIAVQIDGCAVRVETYQTHPDHGEPLALAQVFDLVQIEMPIWTDELIAQQQALYAEHTSSGDQLAILPYTSVGGTPAITRLFAPWRSPDDPVGPGPEIDGISYLQGLRSRGAWMFTGPDAIADAARLASDVMAYRADYCLPTG